MTMASNAASRVPGITEASANDTTTAIIAVAAKASVIFKRRAIGNLSNY